MSEDTSSWSIILGPPGTGKTTTILNLIEMEMEKGTPPDKIGYFAFKTQSVTEKSIKIYLSGTFFGAELIYHLFI